MNTKLKASQGTCNKEFDEDPAMEMGSDINKDFEISHMPSAQDAPLAATSFRPASISEPSNAPIMKPVRISAIQEGTEGFSTSSSHVTRNNSGQTLVGKIIPMQLANDSHKTKICSSLAELSHPAHMLNCKFKDKNRKPQGQKRKKPKHSAKYHNWHTPFAWSQIEIAVQQVGWKMSASDIVKAAQKLNCVIFAGLHWTTQDTVEGFSPAKNTARE
ncbi:hypothetical protein F5148DRAFT_1152921 [Russula earlei]|uniref:Uncharacterized protein n=1 Tax=Russula earlei TaxID=71964 RepID=A0ACC0TWC0_9AGAM|nr:hypothetical protein F5148DRAFT_1152921 [Russula earlei]